MPGWRARDSFSSVRGKRNGSISQIPATTGSTREAAHERRRPASADFAQRCQGVSGLPPVWAPRTVKGSDMIVHASRAFDLDVLRRDRQLSPPASRRRFNGSDALWYVRPEMGGVVRAVTRRGEFVLRGSRSGSCRGYPGRRLTRPSFSARRDTRREKGRLTRSRGDATP